MTGFPGAPRLVKGGIVLLDSVTGALQRMVALQYNPDSLSRVLQPQALGPDSGDHLEALRIKGPPSETIKLEAELDATDQLEHPDSNPDTVQLGILPELAALEMLVYPPSERLQRNHALASLGTLEIAPVIAPLTLFVWGSQRVVPVRLTDFTITEEAFDTALNPVRAKIALGMRVLSINDLPFDSRGGSLFMIYHQQKERLSARSRAATAGTLGLRGVP